MADDADGGVAEAAAALETAVDDAIAVCDGDARAAVRALLVALDAMDRDIVALEAEIAEIKAGTSEGYVRVKLRRQERA